MIFEKIEMSNKCTFIENNGTIHYQLAFECITCGLRKERSICGHCADNCHSGHVLGTYPQSKTVFHCRCGYDGVCENIKRRNHQKIQNTEKVLEKFTEKYCK